MSGCRGSLTAFVALIALAGTGCSGSRIVHESSEESDAGTDAEPDAETDPARIESLFSLPSSFDELAGDSFFDHPWPSDLRVEADGSLTYQGFPNPRARPILDVYVDALRGTQRGYSPVAPGCLRFTGALHPSTLPESPPDTLRPESSVQLIDVDPSSPERGSRKLVSVSFRASAAVYYGANALLFMPALGYPLRPATRYALLVTNGVRGLGGEPVVAGAELLAVLGDEGGGSAVENARAELGETLVELERAGVDRSRIVHLAPFTTSDPTAEATRLRDFVLESYPAPDVLGWVASDETAGLALYEGEYGPSPDFQAGTLPFADYGDGGAFEFEADGTPVVQRESALRFALAVPRAENCPMPDSGYPIVLYAHGTGGNYRSLLGANGEAEALAARCIATMGTDQIFHGSRPGAPPGGVGVELLFFNVINPVAARANTPASAVDLVQQARLFTESGIAVPAGVSRTGEEIRFDASRLGFMGHSQGGLNGPLFLAIDDQARGGVLSGSASLLMLALLEKTEPIDVGELMRELFLGLSEAEAGELDLFHPALGLAQTLVDPADPIHYVGSIAELPREGFAKKSLFMTEGVNADGSGDSYAPPHGIEVQAVAAGLPPEAPLIHPIEELAWGALEPVEVPPEGLSGNLGGEASGVLSQWPANQASDGHFVIYDIPEAMAQAGDFLRNLLDEPRGRVPAREP